jgi:hypothetical protein
MNYAKEAASAYETYLSHTSQRPTPAAFQDFVILVCQAHFEVAEGRPDPSSIAGMAAFSAATWAAKQEQPA